MSVLNTMLKYVGYYILMMVLISFFAISSVREPLTILCGGLMSISMFAEVIQMLIGGDIGILAHKISDWCFRGSFIMTSIVIITGIGLDNILNMFARV